MNFRLAVLIIDPPLQLKNLHFSFAMITKSYLSCGRSYVRMKNVKGLDVMAFSSFFNDNNMISLIINYSKR